MNTMLKICEKINTKKFKNSNKKTYSSNFVCVC